MSSVTGKNLQLQLQLHLNLETAAEQLGSVFGQIQYTKPPEHLYLPNKSFLDRLLQLVLVRVSTWSRYMIGVNLILQLTVLYTGETHFHRCLNHGCFLLIQPIHVNMSLMAAHYPTEICGRQQPQKLTKGGSYSRHPFPSLPNPNSLFPPISESTTQANNWPVLGLDKRL